MGWLLFLVGSLATFRLSLLLVDDPGPWYVLDRLKERFGLHWVTDLSPNGLGDSGWAADNAPVEVLSCFWCVSLAVGFLVAWLMRHRLPFWPLTGLAFSSFAIWFRVRYRIKR